MQIADLAVFEEAPFLFWVKDESGTYLWGNRSIHQLANEDVTGKTDRELIWASDAESLQAADKRVFETGKPIFLHEHVDQSQQGKTTLNVCKWLAELEGKQCCFGISFTIQ